LPPLPVGCLPLVKTNGNRNGTNNKTELKISGLMLRRSLNGTLDLIAVGFNQWQESRHAAFDLIANI